MTSDGEKCCRSRPWVCLLILSCVPVACGCYRDAATYAPDPETEAEVRGWLLRMPSLRWHEPPRMSLEEWAASANHIDHIEEALLWLLERDDDPSIRDHIVIALAYKGTSKSVSALVKVLKYEPAYMQAFAAVALGRIGDVRGAEALCVAARESPELNVRSRACEALGRLRCGDARRCLEQVVADSDEDPFVREVAADGLASICSSDEGTQ